MNNLKIVLLLIPATIFLLIFLTFFFALKIKNPNQLPSALINKPAPEIQLTHLGNKELPRQTDLTASGVKVVNFWASWCAPCRTEHSNLQKISSLGYPVIGINYKDIEKNALLFLDELGDPYISVGADLTGRIGIDWGLYGVPETFVLDGQGHIIFRHPGPVTATILNDTILPTINKIR